MRDKPSPSTENKMSEKTLNAFNLVKGMSIEKLAHFVYFWKDEVRNEIAAFLGCGSEYRELADAIIKYHSEETKEAA